MNRTDFHKLFKSTGPAVLPVIHVLDIARTIENVQITVGEGAAGCFLINHDFDIDRFEPIIRAVRSAFPALWMGVNFLAVTGRDAFPVLASLQQDGCDVDAYWADDARIDEAGGALQPEAEEIDQVREACGWTGMYFGGTAFKKQREVSSAHYTQAARAAANHMEVITTSGVATGKEADLAKIEAFRNGIHDRPLALASGITPDNAERYADVDCFLVATGINQQDNFYDINPARLKKLMQVTRKLGGGKIS